MFGGGLAYGSGRAAIAGAPENINILLDSSNHEISLGTAGSDIIEMSIIEITVRVARSNHNKMLSKN